MLTLARAPTSLNYGQIIMLAYIKGFENCFITNKALAELLGTSERTIKRWVQELKEKNLLNVYYEEENGRERRILEVPKMTP